MQRLKIILMSSVFFVQTAAFALEPTQEHVQVESRSVSHLERVAIQEERAEQEKGALASQPICQEKDQESVSEGLAKTQVASSYHSTHLGAYHHPTAITPMGEKIELEDGSIWSIDPNHRYRTLNWMTYDTIIATTNRDFFSSYLFRLVNLTTGQSVASNLSLGPIVNGVYTHWIVHIDGDHRELCLDDGSVWKLSRLDDKVFKKWKINDTVIIGINNRAFSCLNANILINVNLLNYARCTCLN